MQIKISRFVAAIGANVFSRQVAALSCDACHRHDGPYSRKRKLFFLTCSSQSRTEVRARVRLFSIVESLSLYSLLPLAHGLPAASAGNAYRHTVTSNRLQPISLNRSSKPRNQEWSAPGIPLTPSRAGAATGNQRKARSEDGSCQNSLLVRNIAAAYGRARRICRPLSRNTATARRNQERARRAGATAARRPEAHLRRLHSLVTGKTLKAARPLEKQAAPPHWPCVLTAFSCTETSCNSLVKAPVEWE